MSILSDLVESLVQYPQIKKQKKEEKKRQKEAEYLRQKKARNDQLNEFLKISNRCCGCGKSFSNSQLFRFTISKSGGDITEINDNIIYDYYNTALENKKTFIQPKYICNIRQVLGDSSKSSKLACQNYVSNNIKGMCNPSKLFCKDCCEKRAEKAIELANEFKYNLEHITIYSINYMGKIYYDPNTHIDINIKARYNDRNEAERLIREKAAEKGCNIIYNFQFSNGTYTGIASKKINVKKDPNKFDYIEEIKQLNELAKQGIISQDEFKTKKEILLNQ